MSVLVFVWQTLRIAIPYLFAAAGGVVAERAGVISLTLEGFMLSGAFGAALGSFYSGSAWVGILTGILAGLAFGSLHALACVKYRADQVVAGIAINLLVVGVTRFFLNLLFDSSSNSPRVPGFAGFFTNPLIWLGILVLPIVAWALHRTVFGLRLRAVGEHPDAALSVGVAVRKVRYMAVALSGVLAGLGGAYLALDQHQFSDEMTAGRGFIALAAIIFGRWDPVRAAIACLLFAAAEAAQIRLQSLAILPSQFVEMIPYILTIVALAGLVGRSRAPAALGKPVT
ncbi:MAG TPA: ABC transporter permease [Longimicrobiales bacterium]